MSLYSLEKVTDAQWPGSIASTQLSWFPRGPMHRIKRVAPFPVNQNPCAREQISPLCTHLALPRALLMEAEEFVTAGVARGRRGLPVVCPHRTQNKAITPCRQLNNCLNLPLFVWSLRLRRTLSRWPVTLHIHQGLSETQGHPQPPRDPVMHDSSPPHKAPATSGSPAKQEKRKTQPLHAAGWNVGLVLSHGASTAPPPCSLSLSSLSLTPASSC